MSDIRSTRKEVSHQEVALFALLRRTTEWQTALALAELAGIPHTTVKWTLRRLAAAGLVETVAVSQGHRYRWASQSPKRSAPYLARLEQAAEALGVVAPQVSVDALLDAMAKLETPEDLDDGIVRLREARPALNVLERVKHTALVTFVRVAGRPEPLDEVEAEIDEALEFGTDPEGSDLREFIDGARYVLTRVAPEWFPPETSKSDITEFFRVAAAGGAEVGRFQKKQDRRLEERRKRRAAWPRSVDAAKSAPPKLPPPRRAPRTARSRRTRSTAKKPGSSDDGPGSEPPSPRPRTLATEVAS